jgi:hypothetical protein
MMDIDIDAMGFRGLKGIRMRPREQRERKRFRISDRRRSGVVLDRSIATKLAPGVERPSIDSLWIQNFPISHIVEEMG